MTVICPNCKTVYNLPSEKARLGAKLRCTVCKQVFSLPDPSAPIEADSVAHAHETDQASDYFARLEETRASTAEGLSINFGTAEPFNCGQQKKRSKLPVIILLILILLSGAGAALWLYTPYLDPIKGMINSWLGKEDVETPAQSMTSLLVLQNLRQFFLENEKVGKIIVVEGDVRNGFDEPRELIRVEAFLYDSQGKVLTSKSQLAGTSVSLFHLQVLSQQELEMALNNKIDVLTNNTNIPPGGTVKFMLVFYNPPEEVTDFAVSIIDASKPELKP